MTINPNITIFGGTGDLTFRKLLPALYTMHVAGKLPENSRILIIGRRDYDSAAYREDGKELGGEIHPASPSDPRTSRRLPERSTITAWISPTTRPTAG